jgi:hypothetical protein
MAAAMSAHWCDLADQLCAETRHLLETHSQAARATPKDEIPLEHIQAWLLLAHAELLRMGEHQAMLTAGRAFRLVQMARLYDADASDGSQPDVSPVMATATAVASQESDESFVDAEERRRTFWLAFSLDRFLCLRSEWPLTLQEEMASLDHPSVSYMYNSLPRIKSLTPFQVRTRLPAPEANFQNNQPVRISFLPDAMTQTGPSTLSPFAECVVLAAVYGRCMAHRRAHVKDHPGGRGSPNIKPYDFWANQGWLAAAVEKRVQMLTTTCSPPPAVDSDPMLLFAHLLAHSAVVFLSVTVQQRAAWHTLEQQLVMAAYERRASVAAMEIVRLAGAAVPMLSYFKVHPFLPDPLSCAAAFLSTSSSSNMNGVLVGGDMTAGVEQLLRVLRDMQVVNSLAREHVF